MLEHLHSVLVLLAGQVGVVQVAEALVLASLLRGFGGCFWQLVFLVVRLAMSLYGFGRDLKLSE